MNINPKPNFQIGPLVNGKNETGLDPTAYTTRGSGAANIKIPARSERIIRVEINFGLVFNIFKKRGFTFH